MFRSIAITLALCFVAVTAQAAPVTYSVSGFTYEWSNNALGREVAITGSVILESESWTDGIDSYTGYTHSRRWDIVSGALISTDFHLHDISGYIWFVSGGIGNLYDEMWRINGEGSDLHFGNTYTGVGFYDVDGNRLDGGQGAIDGTYSQLAPIIQFKGENEGWLYSRRNSNRVYSGGQLTLTQVPIPTSVWLFGSALGLVGVMRRKAIA